MAVFWGGASDWQCLEELDGSDDLVARYTYAPGYMDSPAVQERDLNSDDDFSDANEVVYYHSSTLYSVYALSNSASSAVERYRYDAYGAATVLNADFSDDADNASDVENPFTYTARRLDSESGLMYYRNRQYSVTLGRFISRDPIGYASGLNLYEYAAGIATRLVDPTGLRFDLRLPSFSWSYINENMVGTTSAIKLQKPKGHCSTKPCTGICERFVIDQQSSTVVKVKIVSPLRLDIWISQWQGWNSWGPPYMSGPMDAFADVCFHEAKRVLVFGNYDKMLENVTSYAKSQECMDPRCCAKLEELFEATLDYHEGKLYADQAYITYEHMHPNYPRVANIYRDWWVLQFEANLEALRVLEAGIEYERCLEGPK